MVQTEPDEVHPMRKYSRNARVSKEKLARSHWETEIVRQKKRGEPSQHWALVVRRDLCA